MPETVVCPLLLAEIATGALLYLFLWRRQDLSRVEAWALIGLYFGYVLLRGAVFPGDF